VPQKSAYNIPFSPKTVNLPDGTSLHFWYSNNAGRGCDNCTIIRSTDLRAATSAKQGGVIAKIRTSAWNGKVNFSASVCAALGLDY